VRLNDRAGFLEDDDGMMDGNEFDLDAGTGVGDDPDFEDYLSSHRGPTGRTDPAHTRNRAGGGYRDFDDLDENDELELGNGDDDDVDADPDGAFASQIESRLIISSSRPNLATASASTAAVHHQQQQASSTTTSGIRKSNIGSRRGAGQGPLDLLSSTNDEGIAEGKEVPVVVEDEIRINTRRKTGLQGAGAGGKAKGQHQGGGGTGGTLNAVMKARGARKGAAS
jgi:hypothetical protein